MFNRFNPERRKRIRELRRLKDGLFQAVAENRSPLTADMVLSTRLVSDVELAKAQDAGADYFGVFLQIITLYPAARLLYDREHPMTFLTA